MLSVFELSYLILLTTVLMLMVIISISNVRKLRPRELNTLRITQLPRR